MKIIDILTKNENTKNIIEKNLPIKLINNKEITNYLKIKWIEIKNNIEKNPKNKFQELANKVIHTNSKDENYNKYIDELDSFINKYWILDKNIFKLILNNIWNIIERFSSINFNKEIANEAVKTNPSVFLNLSTELRKDEDIIKSTIKDKNYFWMAYFINIDSPEVLVKSFNLLKELWVDKKDILRFPNFKNSARWLEHPAWNCNHWSGIFWQRRFDSGQSFSDGEGRKNLRTPGRIHYFHRSHCSSFFSHRQFISFQFSIKILLAQMIYSIVAFIWDYDRK